MMFYRSPAISWDDAQGLDKFQDLVFESNLVAVLRLKGDNKIVFSPFHVFIFSFFFCFFFMATTLGPNSFIM